MARIVIEVPEDQVIVSKTGAFKPINLAEYLKGLDNDEKVHVLHRGVYDVKYRKIRNEKEKKDRAEYKEYKALKDAGKL